MRVSTCRSHTLCGWALALLLMIMLPMAAAFVHPSTITRTSLTPGSSIHTSSSSSTTTSTQLHAAAVAKKTKNPFQKLPWNVRKEQAREARRLQQERAVLHRQLGIANDATYEEIVEATNQLLAKAGSNLKERVQIEVAKDKILQIRLNERLAGLAQTNREARAQSSYEVDGVDQDDKPQAEVEWNAPVWTRGLIVKPDEKHLKGQLRLWGIITLIGAALPPAQDYLGRFTWLVCVAQLTFRGMPREDMGGGGLGISFNTGSGGGGHRKVAFALGFSIWIVGAIVAYGLMPSWARGQRWSGTVAFAMQNLIFGLASCYLQPYKG